MAAQYPDMVDAILLIAVPRAAIPSNHAFLDGPKADCKPMPPGPRANIRAA